MTSIGMASRVPHSVILVGLMLGGCEFDESGGGVDPSNAHGFGQPVRVGQVEVTVKKVQYLDRLFSLLGSKVASEGAVFVAVDYDIKNVSRKAVGSFDGPRIELVSPDGGEFEWDLDSSTYYTRSDGNNNKVVSDLNPGITVKGDTVFEISSEMVGQGQWFVKFSAGFWESEDVLIKIPGPGKADDRKVTAEKVPTGRPGRLVDIANGETSEQSRSDDVSRKHLNELGASLGRKLLQKLAAEKDPEENSPEVVSRKDLKDLEASLRQELLEELAAKKDAEENSPEVVPPPEKPSVQELAKLKGELAALGVSMDEQRREYKKAQEIINKLTNNRRTPVQEGSRAYYQCLEASKIITAIEKGAPAMKARKAALEAEIKVLGEVAE